MDIPGPPEHPAPQPEPSASGQPPGDEPAELPDIQNPGDIQPPTMGDVGGIVAQEAQQQAQEVVNEGINEVKSIFNVDKAVQLAKDLAAQAASTIANSAITSYFGF